MTTVFARILVALDGSPFSEPALQLAKAVRGPESECSLLQVITPKEALSSGREISELLQDAREYLQRVGESHLGSSVKVLAESAESPADRILKEADGHELVVLMTHGRGGLGRWVWGSVASRVVRHCAVPILLGNAKAETQTLPQVKKILVPLDGSERAASVLDLVGRLAHGFDAEVVLFRAAWVDPTDNALAYARETDALRKAIKSDLERVAEPLRRDGVSATPQVSLDYPAEAILKAARNTGSDLIAMTTHGRTGLKRWLLGSVAEKVLRASTCPVLLVRVPSEQLRSGEGPPNE